MKLKCVYNYKFWNVKVMNSHFPLNLWLNFNYNYKCAVSSLKRKCLIFPGDLSVGIATINHNVVTTLVVQSFYRLARYKGSAAPGPGCYWNILIVTFALPLRCSLWPFCQRVEVVFKHRNAKHINYFVKFSTLIFYLAHFYFALLKGLVRWIKSQPQQQVY